MYSFASQKISLTTEKGTGVIPGWETKIPQAMWCSQKKKIQSNLYISISTVISEYEVIFVMLFSHSVMSDSVRPQGLQHTRLSLCFTNSQSLLKFISIESVMPSNYLILFCPLLLLPSTFPSIRIFSNESALRVRWPKYWSFTISPSNEYSELISFRLKLK